MYLAFRSELVSPHRNVILSEVAASGYEAATQSKDPSTYPGVIVDRNFPLEGLSWNAYLQNA
jgi:hypothetical protein